MGKIIAAEYLTLDGVMGDPAWTVPYWSDELAALQEELFNECDLLLGRITYDGMSKAWPAMADAPGAAGMNSIPKLVAKRTLTQLEWNAKANEPVCVRWPRTTTTAKPGAAFKPEPTARSRSRHLRQSSRTRKLGLGAV